VSLIPAELRGPEVISWSGGGAVTLSTETLITTFPGTPDTVIPATPDTVIPATPDTVIPANPGRVVEPRQITYWVGFHDAYGNYVRGLVRNPFSAPSHVLSNTGQLIATLNVGGGISLGYDNVSVTPGSYGVTTTLVRIPGPLIEGATPQRIIPGTPQRIIPGTPQRIIPGTPPEYAMLRTDFYSVGVFAGFAASIGAWTHATASGQAAVGFTRLRASGGRLYGVPVVGSGATWQDAVASLRWRTAGMPWWGGAESVARAGTLVARDAWTDSTRAVRYTTGAGTTRAVAVGADGAVLTASTFGASEYLADDWRVYGATVDEPPEVDITGLVLSGGTAWAVVRQTTHAQVPDDSTNPADPETETPPGSGLPQEGSGFVYLRNGVVTLVPARDYETEQLWMP
jgi:hypothetical protein